LGQTRKRKQVLLDGRSVGGLETTTKTTTLHRGLSTDKRTGNQNSSITIARENEEKKMKPGETPDTNIKKSKATRKTLRKLDDQAIYEKKNREKPENS